MELTFNQVVRRIKRIALAHKQVRTFERGLVTDFIENGDIKYPAVFLQDTTGTISPGGHTTAFGFRMFFQDLVHVSQNTKDNELDVQSDMVSVAKDLVAEMNRGEYSDWFFSSDNQLTLTSEGDDTESNQDMPAGCYIDFTIRTIYTQAICEIPTDVIDFTVNQSGDRTVFDYKYTTDGTEGTALTIPTIAGKDIVFLSRESGVLYKVSNLPDTVEYTWDGTNITLGLTVNPAGGERFLILYRNF